MKVVISLDNRKLKHYLKNCTDCQYISFAEKKEELNHLLNRPFFKEIKIFERAELFKERFAADYTDLVAQVGMKYDTVYWWVTGTSAKNQFASKFFENLFIFFVIVDELERLKKQNTTLLVIEPPREIVSSISKHCKRNSIDVEVFSNLMGNFSGMIKGKLTRYLITIFFLSQIWWRISISRKYLKKNLDRIQRNEQYYILRSWFYLRSIKENGEYYDSFFGMLPGYLVKNNKKLMVIAGIWSDYREVLMRIAVHEEHLIVPQELLLSYADALKVIADIYLNRIKLNEKFNFRGVDISDILEKEISREFNGKGLLVILRDSLNYYYIKRLADFIKIETFTTTYENYPWEKMCFMALRKYSPQTKIIGYQHAPLSKASLSMRLSKHEKNIIPMPDKIVTIGNITKTFLETVGNYEKNKVEVGCALRFARHSTSKIGQRVKSYRILLVLRGIPPVVRDSLSFVYKALKDNEKYKLIIRPHPALPPEKFKHILGFDVFSCKNFSISANTSVEKDLNEADIVLYDASAVAIEALMIGMPVVNIVLGTILNADPLFQCNYLKWTARKEEDLLGILDAIYQLTDEEYYYQQKKAKEFIDAYVTEVTDAGLSAFI